jgi:hypothetical protein
MRFSVRFTEPPTLDQFSRLLLALDQAFPGTTMSCGRDVWLFHAPDEPEQDPPG